MSDKSGYVYLATRKDMPGVTKIGRSANPKKRMPGIIKGAEHILQRSFKVKNQTRAEERMLIAFNFCRKDDIFAQGERKIEYFNIEWRKLRNAFPCVMSTNPDSKKNEQKEKKQKPDTFWSEMASLQKQRKNAEFEEAARSVKKPDNEKGGDGRTLLMLAAECGWTKAMKILLAKPAAGNINFSVVTGKTALIISAKWCQPAAVRLLLEKDASINHVCAYGWTALDYAEFRDVGTRFISAKELKHPKIAKKIKDNRKVKEILRKNGGKLAAEL